VKTTLKLSCDERFTHAFTACGCVFKEITLVWVNPRNFFENATVCSKRMRKTLVATQLKRTKVNAKNIFLIIKLMRATLVGGKNLISVYFYINKKNSIKLSCDSRFQCAFTACVCVFKEITLVGSSQRNYFENAAACSKRTLKTIVATQLN